MASRSGSKDQQQYKMALDPGFASSVAAAYQRCKRWEGLSEGLSTPAPGQQTIGMGWIVTLPYYAIHTAR